jgi:SNF2 family DNA or RNA helicase
MFTQKITRPFLVTVPLSTLENWKREFHTWLPEATVLVYTGSKQSRQLVKEIEFFFDLQANGQRICIPKFNVLLTSYDSLRTDLNDLTPFEW